MQKKPAHARLYVLTCYRTFGEMPKLNEVRTLFSDCNQKSIEREYYRAKKIIRDERISKEDKRLFDILAIGSIVAVIITVFLILI